MRIFGFLRACVTFAVACSTREVAALIGAFPPSLGFDGLGHSPVFVSQPPVTEMQVELGGRDRTMPGLDLQRLDAHARLAAG